MSNIEKAIAWFENQNKYYDDKKAYQEDYHMNVIALAALHAEQQRKKGCCSCNGGFGDNTIEFHKSGYHNCPYCGRKLDELKPKEGA